MSLLDVLKSMIPVELIDGANVDEAAKCVDLEIEFQPVLPYPVSQDPFVLHSEVPTPCRVQAEGSRWCVWIPGSSEKYRWATDDQLKVMRARYLLLRGYYHRTIQDMPHGFQQEVVSKFFPGGLFKPNILIKHDQQRESENGTK
jgi:hypothetical protein